MLKNKSHPENLDIKGEQKSSYRFFVGQQLFPDPEEVFAELSQAFNEALLQFFTGKKKKTEGEESYYLFSQLNCEHINLHVSTRPEKKKTVFI